MPDDDYGAPQPGPPIPPRTQEETADEPRGQRPSREELEERSRRIGESRKPAGPAQDEPSDVPPTPPPDLAS